MSVSESAKAFIGIGYGAYEDVYPYVNITQKQLAESVVIRTSLGGRDVAQKLASPPREWDISIPAATPEEKAKLETIAFSGAGTYGFVPTDGYTMNSLLKNVSTFSYASSTSTKTGLINKEDPFWVPVSQVACSDGKGRFGNGNFVETYSSGWDALKEKRVIDPLSFQVNGFYMDDWCLNLWIETLDEPGIIGAGWGANYTTHTVPANFSGYYTITGNGIPNNPHDNKTFKIDISKAYILAEMSLSWGSKSVPTYTHGLAASSVYITGFTATAKVNRFDESTRKVLYDVKCTAKERRS